MPITHRFLANSSSTNKMNQMNDFKMRVCSFFVFLLSILHSAILIKDIMKQEQVSSDHTLDAASKKFVLQREDILIPGVVRACLVLVQSKNEKGRANYNLIIDLFRSSPFDSSLYTVLYLHLVATSNLLFSRTLLFDVNNLHESAIQVYKIKRYLSACVSSYAVGDPRVNPDEEAVLYLITMVTVVILVVILVIDF